MINYENVKQFISNVSVRSKFFFIFFQDFIFIPSILYVGLMYFFYYSIVYFISLFAICRVIGLFNRYFLVGIDISTIVFTIGFISYLFILFLALYFFIKETFFNKYEFTEEFFKEKALHIVRIQKTNRIYKLVLYILYIFDAQDFVINNVRFGRVVMSYYLVLFLYKKYGLKNCLLGIRKFYVDRNFYEKIRYEYIISYKHLHQAVLEGILEKLAVIPEGEDEQMTFEQTLQYWTNLIFFIAQGSIDYLNKEQVIVKDFNAMELFFDDFQAMDQNSEYNARLRRALSKSIIKEANFYDKSKFFMFSYFSTNLLYFSMLILWFIPQIKYLKMRDKNFFQIYKYKLYNINIQTKDFIIKNSFYIPNTNALVKLNPHFHFFFKPGVTRTLFDLAASKKIDAGFVELKVAPITITRKRKWYEFMKLTFRKRSRGRLLSTITKHKRYVYEPWRRRALSFKFELFNRLRFRPMRRIKKHKLNYLYDKRAFSNIRKCYIKRFHVLHKAVVDTYINERIMSSLSSLGLKSIKTYKELEIARRLIRVILKNLKTEELYSVHNFNPRYGPGVRIQRALLFRKTSYKILAMRRFDHPAYWKRSFGYPRRRTILENYSINWMSGKTYFRNNTNVYDKKSLRADWITTNLNDKFTANGKSLGIPIEKAIYSHALTNYPGDCEPEEWHYDQLIAELEGSEDNFTVWFAFFQMGRVEMLQALRKEYLKEKYNIIANPYDVFFWPKMLNAERVKGTPKQWRLEQRKFIATEHMTQLISPIYHASIRTRHTVGEARYLERTRFLSSPELVTHDFVAVVPDPENPKQPFGDLDILYEYRYGFNTYDYDDASLVGYNFFPLGEEIWGYTGYHKSIDEMIHFSYRMLLGPGTPRDKCINLSGDYGLPGNIHVFLFFFKLYIVTFISLFLINKSFYKWVLKMCDWLVVLFIVVLYMLMQFSISKRFIIFFVILQCFEPIFGDIGFINLLDFIATICEINDGRFVD